jgi:hypothetical protein
LFKCFFYFFYFLVFYIFYKCFLLLNTWIYTLLAFVTPIKILRNKKLYKANFYRINMTLKLNQKNEYRQIDEHRVPIFREFYGANVEQMPNLIQAGRMPMSVAGIMQRRLNLRNASEVDVKTAWMDNYFDIGDAVVYHPNGDVKIVFDSQTLREMTSESQRNGGALVLGEDVYQSLQGEVFKKGEVGTVNSSMSKTDVKAHPVWKVLARDQGLLNDYADFIFAEGKERFGYDKAMGVYPSSCNGKAPEMRAFYISTLYYGSDVCGGDLLHNDVGRLVGVAPEALGAQNFCSSETFYALVRETINQMPCALGTADAVIQRMKSGNFSGKGASNVRVYTMTDVQTARAELEALSQVRPELLKGTKSLLGKL